MKLRRGRIKTPIVALVVLAALALSAASVSPSPIRRGAIELNGSLSFDRTVEKIEMGDEYHPDGINTNQDEAVWSTTQLMGSPAIGWFVTDRLELAARFRFQREWMTFEAPGEEDGNHVDWSFGATTLAFWNVPGNTPVSPYLGGGGGLLCTKRGGKTTVILPHLQGGLRFFFGDRASLNTGFFYERRWNDDVQYSIQDGDTWDFGFLLGISAFL